MTEIRDKITNLIQPSKNYVVALSGGVDSSVLLHVVKTLTPNVRSLFVNHNQQDSNSLQKSAEKFAEIMNVEHTSLETELELGASETKMREARYQLLFSNLMSDEILLLGHHHDDKIETFLMNLFRGTRLKGLISIKQKSQNTLRPFTEIKKTSIIKYAKQNDIRFVEDSSNKDNSVLRNWLRNELIPDIEKNFKGDLNSKIQNLILEIEELTRDQKKLIPYIKHAKGYLEIPLSDIDDEEKFNRCIEGFDLPEIKPEDLKALDNLNLGNYWAKQAGMYFTLLRQKELLSTRAQFATKEEELEAYRQPPSSTIVKFRVMTQEPKYWSRSKYGE